VKLFLWKLSQDENDGYDTYDSAVVVAKNEYEARLIHPTGDELQWDEKQWTWLWAPDESDYGGDMGGWAAPRDVKAVLVGDANSGILSDGDVVCASFHAG
jgi:hypothetical protein